MEEWRMDIDDEGRNECSDERIVRAIREKNWDAKRKDSSYKESSTHRISREDGFVALEFSLQYADHQPEAQSPSRESLLIKRVERNHG